MSYHHINEMFGSLGLRDRIIAAIAREVPGVDPVQATVQFMWPIIARDDWVKKWSEAPRACSECGHALPDLGSNEDVITDGMILSAVHDVKNSQAE